MEIQRKDSQRHRSNVRMVFGIGLAVFGVLMLLKMFHILPPIAYSFHFGWPIVLVVVGLVIGVRSNFRNNAWWILLLIGGAHLIPPFYIGDVPSRRVLWAGLLVLVGLAMIFRKSRPRKWDKRQMEPVVNDADTLHVDVTFGGRKEIVTSHSFRGGFVRANFAGAEINLAAADSDVQPVVLEVHASFAGIELIVPAHWEIQNEINPFAGSVEDHRMIRTRDAGTEKKTLILRGSCSFGSVEIKSY